MNQDAPAPADRPASLFPRRAAAEDVRGFLVHRGLLDEAAQAALMAAVGGIWQAAPPLHPVTRWGRPMSVAMTSAGALGWTSDRRGYRYDPCQPDGRPWPAMPAMLLDLWHTLTGLAVRPDSCLVNLYRAGARMGMHQDRDDADLSHPVVSVSLGDDALLRIGNLERGGTTQSLWLHSGDVVVMGARQGCCITGSTASVPNGRRWCPAGGG